MGRVDNRRVIVEFVVFDQEPTPTDVFLLPLFLPGGINVVLPSVPHVDGVAGQVGLVLVENV